MLAIYTANYRDLDEHDLRVRIMSDERYVVRTGRLAGTQAAHAPVWRPTGSARPVRPRPTWAGLDWQPGS